jgi:hypothetical protein
MKKSQKVWGQKKNFRDFQQEQKKHGDFQMQGTGLCRATAAKILRR